MKYSKVVITIETTNDSFCGENPDALQIGVADVLYRLAHKFGRGEDPQGQMDINGNTVARVEYDPDDVDSENVDEFGFSPDEGFHAEGFHAAGRKISLTQAGTELKKSYPQVLRLVMIGRLKGGQDETGRWVVDLNDLERLKAGGK